MIASEAPASPFQPQHPGAILRESLMRYQLQTLADSSGLTMEQLSAILHCEAPITPGLSRALAAMLGTSETLWSDLQHEYDQHTML